MTITRRHYAVETLDNVYRVDFDRKKYTISSIDLGDIPASFSTYSGTAQMGETITSRHLGSRDVTIQGHIVSDTVENMRQLKRELQKIILPTQDFWLIVDDTYKLRCTANTTLQYSKKWYQHNNMLTSFTIDATASNPFFTTYDEKIATIGDWSSNFHFPFSNEVGKRFTFGARPISDAVKVYNECEVPVGMTIVLTCAQSTVTYPKVTNADTGEYFRILKQFDPGTQIKITTDYGNKTVVNMTTGENLLQYIDFSSSWLQMEPGYSAFSATCNTGGGYLDCQISYKPLLVEV